MHKFTLFTILLSIITISIVVDIVANGYSLSSNYVPERNQATEKVLSQSDFVKRTVKPNKSTTPKSKKADTKIEKKTDDEISLYSFAEVETINTLLLEKAGIKGGKIKKASSSKLYLQSIELPENIKNRLKIVNLFDFEEYLGTMYALHFQNLEQAEQFYSNLKAKSLAIAGASIRETNTFGNSSFYFNQEGKTKTAFVTVRIGSSIYGFEYPHKNHQIFKNLGVALESQ